jgi:hypothetical protein
MKKLSALLFALCVLSAPVLAAEKFQPPGEAELRAIAARAEPSVKNNIDVLAPFSGEWEYTALIWDKPGAEPQKAFGKLTNKMTLGNRFLASTAMGALNIGGHETVVNGEGKIGYDNAKGAFTSVWADTLSTGMMVGTGTYDEKEKTITETGTFTNPINGDEERFRSEIKLVDADNYERRIYTTGKSGKETKLMEFRYVKGM